MFRRLDYQDRVLTAVDTYIDVLKAQKTRADGIRELAAQNPSLGLSAPDFTQQTWEVLMAAGKLPRSRAAIPFSARRDGCQRPVPNVVLKVPTAGGKTWLAVSSVARIMGRYLGGNTGFVLWIVPNEAIYTQTLTNLKNRQHPYRQALDQVAVGRVRIMEKTDRLDAREVDNNFCIMLLMLQSANRETQESLKMFQDRGDVHGFFPPEGEQQAHQEVVERTPNLAVYSDLFPMVKDSLGNALRIVRPVVVVDEGHRAISDLAFGTLYGFNPSFVLELTATPRDVQPRGGRNPRSPRYANLLVEVTGRELDREGMIKMPLNLDPRQSTDWRTTLDAALQKLHALDAQATRLRADTGRYIRPILLVQVERTGADQRESRYVHAEDVKNRLLIVGFDEAEIAIKTATQNDLSQPENQNLLSPTNRIRAIITRQALQEGWDCPFAYVLCSLAASSNPEAMTQLVGRILRQPGAAKTGVDALDECHVITHHVGTASVVATIKAGLEQDGLSDLVLQVSQPADGGWHSGSREIERRPTFESAEIYLPRVMITDGCEVRELDYETDILSRIEWRGFNPTAIAASIPENAQPVESQLQRIRLTEEGDEVLVSDTVADSSEVMRFDPAHSVRMILDIVPNPFVGYEIVSSLLAALKARGFSDQKLGQLAGLILEEIRQRLDGERTIRAESLFRGDVASGRIQFRLRVDGRNWRMPFRIETNELDTARQLLSRTGGPLQKSLFTPVYESELNREERDVAVYLDSEKALTWWHRNVARRQYGLQGWNRSRIYPDFIFAIRENENGPQIIVLETKGDHLDNPDTAYKRDVLSILSDNFAWENCTNAGELEVIKNNGKKVQCVLILMSEWNAKLPAIFATS